MRIIHGRLSSMLASMHHLITCRIGESTYKATLCYNPEYNNLISHLHQNLETYDILNTGYNISPLPGAVHAHNTVIIRIIRSDIEKI
jgi:hypothetical protein